MKATTKKILSTIKTWVLEKIADISSLIPVDVMRTASDATLVNGNHDPLFYLRQANSSLAGLMPAAGYTKLNDMPSAQEVNAGLAYDVSVLHPTSGVNGGSTYASLSAALAVIPQDKRKCGMTVKFVLSSDNKYVQYRCMAQNFTTDVIQWQGVDKKPIGGSINLVESGGVINELDKIYTKIENISFSANGNGIATNVGVGNIVDIDNPSHSATICYAIADVTNAQRVRIKGYGGNTYRLWCFIDSDNRVISVAEPLVNNSNSKEIVLDIPEGAVKIVMNCDFSFTHYLHLNKVSGALKQFEITTELNGYIKYENGNLLFKELAIKDIYTNKNYYLSDGTHAYYVDNEIDTNNQIVLFYIKRSELSASAVVTIHTTESEIFDDDAILLGSNEKLLKLTGGLIGDIVHYKENSDKILQNKSNLSDRQEKVIKLSDRFMDGFYRSDNGQYSSDTSLVGINKINVIAADNIRFELDGIGLFGRVLFWNDDSFVGTILVSDGICQIPNNVNTISVTFALNFNSDSWRNYSMADLKNAVIKISPYNNIVENDTLIHYQIGRQGVLLRDNGSILLAGASFASPANGWFELACSALGQTAINKARDGGISILDTANEMAAGTLYSASEFEQFDTLVLMHVLNYRIDDKSQILEKESDYTLPFAENRNDATMSAAFDYVIKKYKLDCLSAKDNPNSKWYGIRGGKPCQIVLCTSWQDNRDLYNISVRRLAAKWRIPLITFDENIGFTKNKPYSETGEQISRWYCIADNYEIINSISYGWHPDRGQDKYIQKKMAAIFVNQIKNLT